MTADHGEQSKCEENVEVFSHVPNWLSDLQVALANCRRGTVIGALIFKARLSPYCKSGKLLMHHSAHLHGLKDNPNPRGIKCRGEHTPWKEGGESSLWAHLPGNAPAGVQREQKA